MGSRPVLPHIDFCAAAAKTNFIHQSVDQENSPPPFGMNFLPKKWAGELRRVKPFSLILHDDQDSGAFGGSNKISLRFDQFRSDGGTQEGFVDPLERRCQTFLASHIALNDFNSGEIA